MRLTLQQQETAKANKQSGASNLNLPRNWIIGLILAVTFVAFANTIANDFAYDDTTQILGNETIRSFSNIPLAFTREVWFWRVLQDKDPNKEYGPTTPYYRPLFTVYLMTGWALFGDWAPGWHLVNVLMHLLAVTFAYLIVERVTKNRRLAVISTLLFALHPLRTESVAWISGVTDLFLALFLLPSFYLYMLYREEGKTKHLAGALFLFLLAAFSKEPAVALPIFIVVYELLIINRGRRLSEKIRPALMYGSMFLIVSVGYFAMRYHALGFIFHDTRFTSYPFHQVLMTIPLVICKYIGLLFWPVNLSIFHATPMVQSPLSIRLLLPLLLVVALAAALWQLRDSTVARFAILWFAVNLLPVLNLSAFGEDFLVQERYVYISSIGFSLLIAMVLVRIPFEKWFTLGSRRTAQATAVGLVLLLMTGRTWAQNTVWKDDMTLWMHGAEAAPDQPMSHFVLGHKYVNLQNWERAVEELEQYVALNPKNIIVINNLAASHLMLYEYQHVFNRASADRAHIDRAIALCERGLGISEQDPTIWDTLGRAYSFNTAMPNNYDRAIACFERGRKLQPDNAMINYHLGAAYVMKNSPDNALLYLEIARQQQSNIPDIYKFMGYAYRGKGQIQDAINSFSQYLQIQPDAADAPSVNQQVKDLRAQLEGAAPKG
ncbi:MAG TPA: tetratricopeptide repeat protein [Blastocatellia bacterium]|nr:tetratricopeptide repeat protein [Blastocatellia bacterium]